MSGHQQLAGLSQLPQEPNRTRPPLRGRVRNRCASRGGRTRPQTRRRRRPVGETMQMLVERSRIIERVDAEAVLGEPRNVWTEQPAAGGHNETILRERLLRALGCGDLHHARLGINRFDAALHVGDVDNVEHIEQRRCQGLGLRLVEPRANYERRLGGNQRDLKLVW